MDVVYAKLTHFAVHLKVTQHCKATRVNKVLNKITSSTPPPTHKFLIEAVSFLKGLP